jgi:4a-hydroxytetrahydrobiopterin dehydratase
MSQTSRDLARGTCKPCAAGTPPLAQADIDRLLTQLHHWRVEDGALRRDFRFPDHYATLAFVNAVAWISHRQDHHPDLAVGYNTCRVTYCTHSVGGLSDNDFICAAKIDALFEL